MLSTSTFKGSKGSIEQTLQEIDGLISLPEIYLKFRRLMEDPNSTMEDYSYVVGCDPNLASAVLKVVNSALFGFPGEVDSIGKAIHLLGLRSLHDVVLGVSAVAALDYPNDIVPLKTFWRCSLFSGDFARLLAMQLNVRNRECLFLAGLLHEIGHLVIYSKYPGQAKQAIARSSEGNPMVHVAEQDILGFHYGQLGARLMAKWRLPHDFQAFTYYQPTPIDAPLNPLETALLHLAHGYAYQLHSGPDKRLSS